MATLLLEAGVHPKIVSDRLGHSQIGITLDLYSHATPTLQQEAAEVLDRVLAPNTATIDSPRVSEAFGAG